MQGKINTKSAASLTMRDAPGVDGNVVAILANGTPVDVISIQGDWLQVDSGAGGIGWVKKDFVDDANGVNGVWDDIKNGVKKGVTAVKNAVTNVFKPAASTAAASTASAAAATMYVNTPSGLRVRQAANDTSAIVTTLSNGTAVTVKSQSNGWAAVTTADGKSGYMALQYLSATKPTVVKSTTTTTTTTNNKPTAPAAATNTTIGMSDNAKKALKIGLVALALGGVGYGIYKLTRPAKSEDAPKRLKSGKGLGSVDSASSSKKSKKKGKKKSKQEKVKALSSVSFK